VRQCDFMYQAAWWKRERHVVAEVAWRQRNNVSKLAGKPVLLRAVMKDADWYAFQFVGS